MRSAYLFICLVLLTTSAFAQTPPTAPLRSERPVAERPVHHEAVPKILKENVQFSSVAGACFHNGGRVTILGRHLDKLGSYRPALKIEGAVKPMDIVLQTPGHLTVRLPDTPLSGDRAYKFILAHKDHPARYKHTRLEIRLCPLTNYPRDSIHPDEILILGDSDRQNEILTTLERIGVQEYDLTRLETLGSVLVTVPGGQNLREQLTEALPETNVDFNDMLSASRGPRLYAKDKIQWPESASCVQKAREIPIGILDGAVDRNHPAFTGQTIREKSFLDKEKPDQDHATALVSILVGNQPKEGYNGLLTGALLFSAVVLARDESGRQFAPLDATLSGLDWLMGKNIRLINVSLTGRKNRVLIKAFEKSARRGTLIFAAAGNEGPDAPPVYPAAIESVFAVTATDAAGRLYSQANRGKYINMSAPGVDIWTAAPGGTGRYQSGTSFAVPYAVAATALYLSHNPALSAPFIAKLLQGDIVARCPFDN